jgi:hypothetical protein
MMAREPADRYPTPRDVADALEHFCRPMPLAAPIVVPILESPPEESRAIRTAESVDPKTAAVAHASVQPRPRQWSAENSYDDRAPASVIKPLLFGAIGVAILISLAASAYLLFQPADKIAQPTVGNMVITLDSPPDRIWARGERKPLVVRIARLNFSAPVTIAVDQCPDWLQCLPVTIGANKDVAELTLMVKYHDVLGPQTLRIVATSPDSRPAAVEYAMEIVAVRAGKNAPPAAKDGE